MTSLQKTARLAGLIYLLVVLSGFFHLLYVPSRLVVPGDAATTMSRLLAGESLFRLGILGGFVCYSAFLVLPVVLHRLLAPVQPTAALLMLVLAAASVPFSFANMLHKMAVLPLLSAATTPGGSAAATIQAQVVQHLQAYREGNGVAQIFWGLWLLPFGYLVAKSGFLPRALGIVLVVGGLGYLADFGVDLLWPGYHRLGLGTFITLPAGLGEMAICLWLLLVGVKARPPVPAQE